MSGLGKNRSKLGEWLDKNGVSQEWLVRQAEVGRSTIQDLASGSKNREPTARTMKKIMTAIRQIDSNAKVTDFWDM
jgi:predicted transcriptional regulator